MTQQNAPEKVLKRREAHRRRMKEIKEERERQKKVPRAEVEAMFKRHHVDTAKLLE